VKRSGIPPASILSNHLPCGKRLFRGTALIQRRFLLVRPYETMVLFDGTLTDEMLKQEQAKVESLLKQIADFEKAEVWGKMPMAYEIRKKRSGCYCLFSYKGEGNIASKLEHEFKLNPAILRSISVVRNTKAPTGLIDPDKDLVLLQDEGKAQEDINE
jgi:ribosomal protein S6